jgi:polysaccharide biosynthesis protein PslH
MRILFLTQVLPYPLDAGPKIRAYYVLRHLSQAHAVTLVSFVRPTDTAEAVTHLGTFCEAVHTVSMVRSRPRDAAFAMQSVLTNRPFIIARDWVPAMARLIDRLVAEAGAQGRPFDAVHADQLWMAPYALRAAGAPYNRRRPLSVLDQHNAVHLIPGRLAEGEASRLKRALLRGEARKMARYEVETCRQFDRVVWVTRQDHEAVEIQGGDGKSQEASPTGGTAHRIPNSAVIPICGDAEETGVVERRPGAQRVTFLGGLHYPPNAQGVLWFAEWVWPRVVAHVPEAVLTVIGKSPPASLAGGRLPVANCEVTGYVEDPRPYLEQTAAFVVPLLAGGGMRVKIVDAWLWGLPVVSTAIGAEGIETRPGENIVIADNPEAFAQATVRLLRHPEERERLAGAGRRWAEERYNWRTAYAAWGAVYEGWMADGRLRAADETGPPC